jgi:hypothetical protein
MRILLTELFSRGILCSTILAAKLIPVNRIVQPPLEAGQLWQMAEADLVIGIVGRLQVQYKLRKPNDVRTPNFCSSIKSVQHYLEANQAVLA